MTGAFGQMRCLPTDTLTNAHVLTCLYTVQEGERLKWKENEGERRGTKRNSNRNYAIHYLEVRNK